MQEGRIWKAGAVVVGILFAGGGSFMGSMNAAWFGLERDANALFPLLGAGVLMVATCWVRFGWGRTLWTSGWLGKAAAVLLCLGAVCYLLNPLLQFAIVGTLAFGMGLVLFAMFLWRHHHLSRLDRLMATFAAIASLTWNTETVSAFLLAAVGLLLTVLSLRLHHAGPAGEPEPSRVRHG